MTMWFDRYGIPVVFFLFVAFCVGVVIYTFVTADEDRAERDRRFAEQCVDQGGRVVQFDGYRPQCIFEDGQRFPE